MGPMHSVVLPDRMSYAIWRIPGVALTSAATSIFLRRHRQEREIRQGGRLRIVDFSGWKLQYDLSNTGDFQQYAELAQRGVYEPATTRLLLDIIQPGDVFVDVGANIGYYSALALSRVGETGKVVAIEPHPDAYVRLQRNMELNRAGNRFRAIPAALSDRAGSMKLRLFGDNDVIASLESSTGRQPPDPYTRSIGVDAFTFDSLFPTGCINFVKMDVEGAEATVLRGMGDTLSRSPKLNLVIEWHPLYRSRALWESLQGRFLIHRIRDSAGGYQLVPLMGYEDARYLRLCNLLCTSK